MMKSLTRETVNIFWRATMKYKAALALIFFSVFAATAADLIQPFIYKRVFDLLATGGPTAVPELLHLVVLAFIVGLVFWAFWRVAGFVNNYFQPRVMSDLLMLCYSYLQEHSYTFFANNFVGSLVQKVGRFQRAYETLSDQLFFNLSQTVIKVMVILAVLYFRSWILGTILLIWAIIYIIFTIVYVRYKWKYDVQKAALDSRTTGHLADTIANNINLKLFNGTGAERQTYRNLTDELYAMRRFTWNLDAISDAMQGLFMVVLEFAMMYAAVVLWGKGLITIGDFALIQAYLLHIFNRLWDLGKNFRRIYEVFADSNEMTEILLEPHEVMDAPKARQLQVNSGQVQFKNVKFYYDQNKPVLQKFNLDIAGGERVALIGPSGGGKSTIVKLLFRFLDIQGGKILIDGQDIARVTQESLRRQISLVPQEPILFHRTLMENIRYGRPEATEEEVIAAAKAAHCHEFIVGFTEGYDTFVGERGVKLSGGERQRVAIARAILKNAPILVLDEATSSLDSESEQLIQDALHTLMKGKTTVVIAHRLSTIMEMDRIVVIEDGTITEQGKHGELLKAKQGTYQKLWEIQAGGFA